MENVQKNTGEHPNNLQMYTITMICGNGLRMRIKNLAVDNRPIFRASICPSIRCVMYAKN